MITKQCKTDFHELIKMINSLEDYSEISNKNEMIEIIKKLYYENNKLKLRITKEMRFGIRYKTIGDDSSYSDTHEVYFLTHEERDNVFDDWSNDLYWDDLLKDDLLYRTPSPNFHSAEKIYRSNGITYVADNK